MELELPKGIGTAQRIWAFKDDKDEALRTSAAWGNRQGSATEQRITWNVVLLRALSFTNILSSLLELCPHPKKPDNLLLLHCALTHNHNDER